MSVATAKLKTAAIGSGGWVQRPGGLLVSEKRLYRRNDFLSLGYIGRMGPAGIDAFNQEAGQYDVHIEPADPPIDRLVKACVYLSRRDNDGSALHTKAEYDSMLIDAATANTKNQEPPASFYKWLKSTPQWDVTRDILTFKGKAPGNMYHVLLHQFNEDGKLVQVDEIKVAGKDGFIRVLGTRGYPVKTSNEHCPILSIADTPISGSDAEGYWYLGSEPQDGEERIALCGPYWDGGGMFDASVDEGRSCSLGCVGALRIRRGKQ